ncbi:MAG: hypothetical protein ACOYLT_10515 [Flavobacterium sp.]|uniref:hypothetical protein n=1 Tax=Flavobacterium sp. TaxID=239 RepID=UPI003BDF8183
MVRVIGANLRTNEKGAYVSLELQGDIIMIQSQKTGRFYATARKCCVYSTFDKRTADSLIGSQMPGTIERVPCDPYDFTIIQTGEVIKLSHTYGYCPHEGAIPSYVTTATQGEVVA